MQSIKLNFFWSELHDSVHINYLKEQIETRLREFFFISQDSGPEIFVILTGGVEKSVLKYVEKNNINQIVLLYHNSANSLPASLELVTYFKELNFFVKLVNCSNLNDLNRTIILKNTLNDLKKSKFGTIGESSEWLVASKVDNSFFEKYTSGLEFIPVSELIEEFNNISKKEIIEAYEKINHIDTSISKDILNDSIKIYVALKKIIEKYKLNAFTIRCFDILGPLKNTSCLALSLLNSENIPAACEGDLPALLTMFLANKLTLKTSFMVNPSEIDIIENTVKLAHCTCPMELIEPRSLKINTHFESNMGTATQGILNPGIYTLLKFGGKNLERYFVTSGIATNNFDWSFELCRTQTQLKLTSNIKEYIENPIGNHLILIQGDFEGIINEWIKIFYKN